MKKYLTAGLLAACFTAPAFAADSKLTSKSPDEPVHRRTVVLCISILVGLHAYTSCVTREKRMAGALPR